MAISEFKVETSPSLSGLELAVNAAIADGWQPLNPVSFADGKYVQQLIKGTPTGGSAGTVEEVNYFQSISLRALSPAMTSAIGLGFDPYGPTTSTNGQILQTLVKGTPPGGGGGGGGGSYTLAGASDLDVGLAGPWAADQVLLVYQLDGETSAPKFTNIPFGATIQSNAQAIVDQEFNDRRLTEIEDATDATDLLTKFNLLLADLKAKEMMFVVEE